MALDPCVKQILCGLSDAALRSMQTIIDGQIVLLQANITALQAQILQYDLLAIPVEAARDAAQAVLTKVRESVTLVPLNLISNCAELGDFNINLSKSLDVATATLDDTVFEATRLLSFRDELNGVVADLQATITQFTDIRGVMDNCLARQ